jgi:hypothetical protein
MVKACIKRKKKINAEAGAAEYGIKKAQRKA